MGEIVAEALKNSDLRNAFTEYAKFGNPKSDGKEITLTNADKWFKEAGLFESKKITTTDTGIEFKKFKARTINFKQFLEYIDNLAKAKKMELNAIVETLAKKKPGTSGATQAQKSNVVDRLTDTSKFTGAHKERFDAEGKGKGIEGREERADNTGYVSGYKEKDTYDKKH